MESTDNTLEQQAEDLFQHYENDVKLGIFKENSDLCLGWTTLNRLQVQDVREFLRLGYTLQPVDNSVK